MSPLSTGNLRCPCRIDPEDFQVWCATPALSDCFLKGCFLILRIFAGFQRIMDTRKRQGQEYPAVGFVMIQTVIKANHR